MSDMGGFMQWFMIYLILAGIVNVVAYIVGNYTKIKEDEENESD